MNRRRFLSISGAALGAFALGKTTGREVRWDGFAFGGKVNISLIGDDEAAASAIDELQKEIAQLERAFSLFDPQSELSYLNRMQRLPQASAAMKEILAMAGHVYQATKGRFDPTIQNLWRGNAGAPIGFSMVDIDHVSFGSANMAMTLNGIAQGFASDRVSAILAAHGFEQYLVNIGEYRAVGRRYVIDIENQYARKLERIGLEDRAVATSSPYAMRSLMDAPHILDPRGLDAPQWATVSVVADSAALADAYSTGLCFASEDFIRDLIAKTPELHRVYLEDFEGRIVKRS